MPFCKTGKTLLHQCRQLQSYDLK